MQWVINGHQRLRISDAGLGSSALPEGSSVTCGCSRTLAASLLPEVFTSCTLCLWMSLAFFLLCDFCFASDNLKLFWIILVLEALCLLKVALAQSLWNEKRWMSRDKAAQYARGLQRNISLYFPFLAYYQISYYKPKPQTPTSAAKDHFSHHILCSACALVDLVVAFRSELFDATAIGRLVQTGFPVRAVDWTFHRERCDDENI